MAVDMILPGSTVQRQCVIIQTLDDMIVEDDETLILFTKVDETLPISFSNTAEVAINDDEGIRN